FDSWLRWKACASDPASFMRNLPANTAYLDYAEIDFSGDTRYVVFLVNRKTIRIFDLGKAPVIEKTVRDYIDAIEQKSPQRVVDRFSRVLYRMLLEPFANKLSNAASLLIRPDGVLHLLPFETLKSMRGKYLLEDFQISYTGNAVQEYAGSALKTKA